MPRWPQEKVRKPDSSLIKRFCLSNLETYITMCKIVSQWEFPVWTQRAQTGALYQPKGGGMGRVMGGKFKREGTYVYLWLIHGDIWQKTTKFCRAIILQLKNKSIQGGKRLPPASPGVCEWNLIRSSYTWNLASGHSLFHTHTHTHKPFGNKGPHPLKTST